MFNTWIKVSDRVYPLVGFEIQPYKNVINIVYIKSLKGKHAMSDQMTINFDDNMTTKKKFEEMCQQLQEGKTLVIAI